MLFCSKAGKGAFTTGITGFAFVPLDMVSSRAEEIHMAAKKKIESNAANFPPGLMEQYKIQLERIDDGAPGVELISFPGFLSFPSTPSSYDNEPLTEGLMLRRA
jgi:hypothetical protein